LAERAVFSKPSTPKPDLDNASVGKVKTLKTAYRAGNL